MVYTCNNCKSHVETRYHCTICDDFDLCVNCKDKDGHPHPMEKLGFASDNGSSPLDERQTNPQENYERRAFIQRCIQDLVHVCLCRDDCRQPNCQKLKRVVMHTKNCRRKINGECPICKRLIALCCYHAKHCQETTECLVPFCSNIKHKIKQQQLQQRLRLQLLRRRLGVMNTRPTGPVAAMQAGRQTSNVAMTTGVAMKPSNLPTPHQLGIGLIPGTQTPPVHVLQVVKEVQEEISRRQALHISYKVTPGGGVGVGVGVDGQTDEVMPPPQMQRPLDQWTAASRYQSNAVMQQNPNLARQQLQLMQQQQQQQQHQPQPMAMDAQMPRQPGVIGPVGQVGPQGSNILQKHALQQLMQTLRSPYMPD
ncbi:histone acetyltransferase p300-like [Temnothorax americanus]|uniref:histone acetyltransferase p300-like n=1 Tax=Temnothorax americanus TaxID=1964332 RepID=UPI004068B62E